MNRFRFFPIVVAILSLNACGKKEEANVAPLNSPPDNILIDGTKYFERFFYREDTREGKIHGYFIVLETGEKNLKSPSRFAGKRITKDANNKEISSDVYFSFRLRLNKENTYSITYKESLETQKEVNHAENKVEQKTLSGRWQIDPRGRLVLEDLLAVGEPARLANGKDAIKFTFLRNVGPDKDDKGIVRIVGEVMGPLKSNLAVPREIPLDELRDSRCPHCNPETTIPVELPR